VAAPQPQLVRLRLHVSDYQYNVMDGTSPSINNSDEIAFHAESGELWKKSVTEAGVYRSAQRMMAGTSPSIADNGEVALQVPHGHLRTGSGSFSDTGLGMMADTSPSITMTIAF
jgi:hypothetical protein